MKIGDLVRYMSANGEWDHILGIVVRQIPGTDENQVVQWMGCDGDNDRVSYPKRQLKVISESR
jgi:hypothetical protein